VARRFGPFGSEDVQADHEWREILMQSWEYDRIQVRRARPRTSPSSPAESAPAR